MSARTWCLGLTMAILGALGVGAPAWRAPAERGMPPAAHLHVSAAISLQGALEQARPLLEKAAGRPLDLNFAASGVLAAQIIHGAPVDVFVSADQQTVDALAAQGTIVPESVTMVASNELVLVVSANAAGVSALADLGQPAIRRIALGEPESVPAGRYARQTLTHAGVWRQLENQHKLIMGENVAQVLAYVARGEADAGFVYRSDAASTPGKVKVAQTVPAEFHQPIRYVLAVPVDAPLKSSALSVRNALLQSEAQATLARFGFVPLPANGGSVASPATPGEQP